MLINHASKQVTAKIVYYGPGLSGKTTNLQYIFSVTHPRSRGELVSMETEIERTIFFDLLPMNVGMIKGYQTKFQLYTVPGQVFYDSTRKLVLRGADGIVFVVDSQDLMKKANIDSLENLKENISFYGGRVDDLPVVFQYNKRDLKNILPIDEISHDINLWSRPWNEAVARTGQGVIETLRQISNLTLIKIRETLDQVNEASPTTSIQFDMSTQKAHSRVETAPFRKITIENRPEEQMIINKPLLTEMEKPREPVKPSAPMSPPPDDRQKAEELRRLLRPGSPQVSPPLTVPIPQAPQKPPPPAPPKVQTTSQRPAAPIENSDGVIRRSQRLALTSPDLLIEIKSKSGEVISRIPIQTQKSNRRIEIVLDLEQ